MSDLSDNVKSAITAVLQSASIHLDYVGDLHQGYYHDANQQAKTAGTTDLQETNNTLDETKHQQHHQNDTSGLASTATGLPDPTAVSSAIDRVDVDKKKEHCADDEPGVASTATGLPASEPVINAMKEAGDDSIQDDSTKENALQQATKTVAPASAAQNVIDNLTPSDSLDGPSPNPSTMKHQQQKQQTQKQQQQQQQQFDPSQSSGNVKLSGDADEGDPNIDVIGAKTDAVNINPNPTEPTHTVIDDNAKSVDPTPVEPMVENIVSNIQAVEEPVVEEKLIREPPSTAPAVGQTSTMDSTCPTPADVKTEDLPNVETRVFVSKPITEHTDPAGQVVVTEDPAADEIKVEQISPSSATTTTTTTTVDNTDSKQMAVADIKAEDIPVAEEPATTDDIKAAKSMTKKGDEPIKKVDGTVNINDLGVEQGSVEQQQPINVTAKEDDTLPTSTSTDDRAKPHTPPAPDNTVADSDKSQQQQQQQKQQQVTTSREVPSRSIESKLISPQSPPQQEDEIPAAPSTDESQEQQISPEPNASKSSKCTIM